MKKIRIGNDIRLAVDLRQYINPKKNLRERDVYNPNDEAFENWDQNPFVNKKYELYYPSENPAMPDHIEGTGNGTPISIRSVKAVLINTTREKNYKDYLKRKTRFIARFPIEPCIEAFRPTPFNICNSGYPTWRAYPREYFHRPYHGFGWHPEWDGIYKPLPMIKDFEYLAGVCATEKQNVVEVSFPAEDQLHLGKYTLVIVAKVFAPGFNNHNLKTVTIDIPDVFELVDTTAEGIDGDVLGSTEQVYDKLPSCEVMVDFDIYTREGEVSTGDKDEIVLDRTDGKQVTVDTSSITGWGDPDKQEEVQ